MDILKFSIVVVTCNYAVDCVNMKATFECISVICSFVGELMHFCTSRGSAINAC